MILGVVWAGGPDQEAAWEHYGQELAYGLQHELDDVEVRGRHG